jgi:hypothetical protein
MYISYTFRQGCQYGPRFCYTVHVYFIFISLCDKFVSEMWQVGGFLQVLWFPPPIKLTATI